jgi:hypothetical protein
MKRRLKLVYVVGMLAIASQGSSASAATTGPYTVSFTNLVTGLGSLAPSPALPFSFPKFDASLGTLSSVNIEWNIIGTTVGSVSGADNLYSFDTTLSHSVFFDFKDVSDNLFIAEPTLSLTASIPAGAQNLALALGPTPQSTCASFSVERGDYRFDSWANGPGKVEGTVDVFFSNTAIGLNEQLMFFPGTDGGVYSGTLSFVYNYLPVPEPCDLAFAAIGLLWVSARYGWRKAAQRLFL